MSDKLVAFYNELYAKHTNPFGNQPTEIVSKVIKYVSGGRAIDFGAGDGRNSLFLAAQGFEVDANDISLTAIQKLQEVVDKSSLKIKTCIADFTSLEFNCEYNVMLFIFILHHVKRDAAISFIKQMKRYTVPGGVNVFSVFTTQGDFFKNNPESPNFFETDNQLEKLYADWEIVENYKEVISAFSKRPDGSPMKNECAFFIARKT